MTVTDIVEVNKAKVRVHLDGEAAFVLYKGELRTYQIKENSQITDDTYQKIMQEVLSKRAKSRCMHLLQTRDYTRKKLSDKLKQGEYPESIITEALEYLTSYGYLDDTRYARNYISYHIQDRSRKKIEMDLIKKGISRTDIQNVFHELMEEGLEDNEEPLIQKLLIKKHFSTAEASLQEQQKMISFLLRKGFSMDKIRKVFNQTAEGLY